MLILTKKAVFTCDHGAPALPGQRQNFVRIGGASILVEGDPVGRNISGCPNLAPPMKPCVTTLKVGPGYSSWIKIDGSRICLSSVEGFTDGTPPGVVRYSVFKSGQDWVEEC